MKNARIVRSVLALLMGIVLSASAFGKTFTRDEARSILLAPEKFASTYDELERSEEMPFGPEHLARQLLESTKDDDRFLRLVFTLYADRHDVRGFVACYAIKNMAAGDDQYFKTVLETYLRKNDYHIAAAALVQVQDQPYKERFIRSGLAEYGKHTKIVEKHPGEFHHFESVSYYVARDAIDSLRNKSLADKLRADVKKLESGPLPNRRR